MASSPMVSNSPIETRLRDGTPILISRSTHCSKECIKDGFEQLSAKSRLLRFHSPISRLSDAQLTYLTDIDDINHVVIGAVDPGGRERRGIGLVRYVRLHNQPSVAEFAITVIDAYQNRGLGSILLNLLIEHARENGIRVLRGYTMEENLPMNLILKHNGAHLKRDEEGSPCFQLDVSPPEIFSD